MTLLCERLFHNPPSGWGSWVTRGLSSVLADKSKGSVFHLILYLFKRKEAVVLQARLFSASESWAGSLWIVTWIFNLWKEHWCACGGKTIIFWVSHKYHEGKGWTIKLRFFLLALWNTKDQELESFSKALCKHWWWNYHSLFVRSCCEVLPRAPSKHSPCIPLPFGSWSWFVFSPHSTCFFSLSQPSSHHLFAPCPCHSAGRWNRFNYNQKCLLRVGVVQD